MDPFRLKLRSCHYGNSQWDKCYTTGLSMRCGDGLIHGTKRHKDNQSERLNHLYKTKFTNIFDDKLRAPKSYGAVAFFYPRPVLAFGYCRCLRLCVSVCLSVCQSRVCPRNNSGPVRAKITKLGPKMQKTLVKIPIFCGLIDLDLQGQI